MQLQVLARLQHHRGRPEANYRKGEVGVEEQAPQWPPVLSFDLCWTKVLFWILNQIVVAAPLNHVGDQRWGDVPQSTGKEG